MKGYSFKRLLNTISLNWRTAAVVIILMSISGYMLSAYGLKKHFVAEANLYIESTDEVSPYEKAKTALMLFTSPRMYDAINSHLATRFSYTELQKMISFEQIRDTQILKASFDCQRGSDAYRLAELCISQMQIVLNDFEANARVRVVQSPEEPTKPVFPDEEIFTISGAIIGAVMSVIGIILIWRLDNTITKTDNITEEYGLPVLGELMDFDREIDYLGR